ncbi:MAG: phospho-sugar mutase [Bacteroidales bacterium]|nr:phospho-sugar mutase [Bacteroidales bacterium]MDZ4204715.1 phospho-sugar mutase [Bacteroidales bacterium]
MTTADSAIIARATAWLGDSFDSDTRNRVQHLIEHEPEELTDSFYRHLEFGTGGLRGIMGVGTNRMNKYTVGMATQGLANYVLKAFPGINLKAAIAYDVRNNSRYFAEITAEVLSANGIEVYLFDDIRPTPLLSFAIRLLGCHTGVMVTASHNPKEYNGYKVYWNDGAQLVSPHDKNVIAEVQQISSPADVAFTAHQDLIHTIGEEIDNVYVASLKTLSLSPEINERFSHMKIVFTPIHGTGVHLVPRLLRAFGFNNIIPIPSQDMPDGNFPTVHSPNPEEPEALTLALKKAKEVNADIVLATDPDGDRVGVAVRDHHGEFVLLNGNQTATVIIYYLLTKWKEKGWLIGKEYIVKTIVTSELLIEMANKFGVESYDVLTGFKYIAEVIRNLEGKKKFIGGGEESYGYLVGDFSRDKDAVIACCIIAEAAAWAASQGKSFFEVLLDIYMEFGFYKEKLLSVTKKGKAGAEAIVALMERYRNNPPQRLAGTNVVGLKDYKLQQDKNLVSGSIKTIDLPTSDVLQFFLEDGSKITIRPSGTEPKIKFYFGIKGILTSKQEFDSINKRMEDRINRIIEDMKV